MNEIKTEELKALGFTKAALEIDKTKEFNRKLSEAYLHYKIVRSEHIEAFNEKLKTRTYRDSVYYVEYEKLVEIDIAEYGAVPPAPVLDKLKEAKKHNCFDYFTIAKIESVKEYKDPILFGRIEGCSDRFFLTDWDNDIKLSELIGE